MPRPPTLKIHEIFSSLQGEGLRQGEPTLFIRLSGCNLRCGFCDTKEAWEGGRDMTVPKIISEVRAAHRDWPSDWVCLTGGEPMIQDLGALTAALKAENFKLQIETNGTRFQDLPIDWWTVSPKPPDYAIHPELLIRAKELKLVISESLHIDIIERMRQSLSIQCPIILQPESNLQASSEKGIRLLQQTSQRNFPHIRFSLQIHKIINMK